MASPGQWVLAVAIAGSALAVGAVHTPTLCIVTATLAVAVALEWWGGQAMNVRSAATVLLITGITLTAYTALQCLPLPIAWVSAIAPRNGDVWSRAFAPLGEPGPKWAPLSLDPVATRTELLKGVAYLLAFVGALRVARRREGVGFLSTVVIGAGVVLCVTALLHPAFGAHRLFGVYEPRVGAGERHLAPLLNPNNLAGYVNIAFCLALAEALAPEPRIPRPIIGSVSVFLIATQLWIASRGGVLSMAVGAIIVVVIVYLVRSQRRHAVATLSWATALVAVAGATLLVLTGSDDASNELLDSNADKLKLFLEALRMVPAMPLFGCGRGAFESSFPAFRTGAGHMTFTHAENVAVQWIVEWGVPLGIGGLAAIAVALRPHAVLARSTTAAGAWAALVALALQNLVDLGSEIPGLMLAAVTCAAIVVAGTRGDDARYRVAQWARAPRAVAISGAMAAATSIVLCWCGIGGELADDRTRLYDAALEHRVSPPEMHSLARAAMMRHPAEPYLPFITGLRAAQARDDNALPWLEATLERASVYAPAHLILARLIAARSPSQARLEYRLTLEQAPELIGLIVSEAPRMVGGFYDANELVPAGAAGVPMLDGLGTALEGRLPATVVRLDAELAVLAPSHPNPRIRAARDACDDLDAGEAAPWCVGQGRAACVRDALGKSLRLEQQVPDQCVGFALHARARASSGDARGALDELERATDTVSDRVECLEKLVTFARSHGDESRAQAALEKLVNSGCTNDAECAVRLNWAATQQEASGNVAKALALSKRAHERAPDDDAVTEHMAGLAARAGLHAEAAEDYEALARRQPGNPRWRKAAEEEHREMLKDAFKL